MTTTEKQQARVSRLARLPQSANVRRKAALAYRRAGEARVRELASLKLETPKN